MYIIIAGCRKVGSSLAIMLSQANHDVVVVDSDQENFEMLGSGFNGLTITGMPIDEDVLRNAGIEKADALAAVSNDDNMNVMISQVATRIFQVPKVITRVYDPEREIVYRKMGITTICPTTLAVGKIKDYLLADELYDSHVIEGVEVIFRYVRPSRAMIGKTAGMIENGHIFGIIRNGHFHLANHETLISDSDKVVLAEYAGYGGQR